MHEIGGEKLGIRPCASNGPNTGTVARTGGRGEAERRHGVCADPSTRAVILPPRRGVVHVATNDHVVPPVLPGSASGRAQDVGS